MKKHLFFFVAPLLFIAFPNAGNLKAQTNTRLGFRALQNNTRGVNNTATGFRALQFNTTGSFNTANGSEALNNNINGTYNTASGSSALFSNTTGTYNTANGVNALYRNTLGNYNTATGVAALFSNTTGEQNTANGVGALRLNTTGSFNTANGTESLGHNTGGNNNSASGVYALFANTTGSSNTAHGFEALLSNTTGGSNTATGASTLRSNTFGTNNTANGFFALRANIGGSSNTASGVSALQSNTTGNFNTATGVRALTENNTGNNNTASGHQALLFNTTGSQNTASGVGALRANTTSSNNTAFGYQALGEGFANNTPGTSNTAVGHSALLGIIGDRNTAIGTEAGVGHPFVLSGSFLGSSTGIATGDQPPPGFFVNVTAVGFQSKVTQSNQVRIGNTSVTSIGGQVSWTSLSDGRFKKDLKEDVPGLAFITQLRPVTYTLDVLGIDKKLNANSTSIAIEGEKSVVNQKPSAEETKAKTEKAKITYTGFVAQEVEKAAKILNYDFSGVDAPKHKEDFYGLRYAEFVVPLVRSVQELDAENKELKKDVEELKELVAKLINEKAISENNTISFSGAYLETNNPNPFTSTTVIRYHLPQNAGNAKLVITNMKGQILKSVAITGKGDGQLTLSAGTLAAGSYTYSMWVNGKQADAKQMLIVK